VAIAIESSGSVTDTSGWFTGSKQTSAFSVGAGGRRIVVVIGAPTAGTCPSVSGVTDTLGNTYSQRIARTDSGSGCAEIWWAWTTGSGSNQVTVAFTGSPSGCAIVAYCLSGAQSTAGGATAVDVGAAGPATLSITPAAAGSFVAAAGWDYNGANARTVTTNATKDAEALDGNNDTSWVERLTDLTPGVDPITLGTTAPILGANAWGMAAAEVLAAAAGSNYTETPSDSASGATTEGETLALGEVPADATTAADTESDFYAAAGTEPLGDSAAAGDETATTQAATSSPADTASAGDVIAGGVQYSESPSDSAAESESISDSSGPAWPYVLNAVDPLAQPPDTNNAPLTDTCARPLILCDNTPGAAGDLFGIVATSGHWYLLLSTDHGATWSYVTGTGTAPADRGVNDLSIAQDTSANKVHFVTFPHSSANALYHRVALTHNETGHISGWAWETADIEGPSFNAAGASNNYFSAKLQLIEVLDGNGAHCLVLAGLDRPTTNRILRFVAARTTAACALDPESKSDWVQIASGAAGYSVFLARNSDTGVDPDALVNLTNQDSDLTTHECDFTIAQLPADRSLHFFTGKMYYNDAPANGDIRRWRFTANGANWDLDTGASGTIIASPANGIGACIGNSAASPNYVWLAYGADDGIHISRIGTNGTWTTAGVTSPETSSHYFWNVSISVGASESAVWAQWEKWAQPTPVATEFSAYYNGSEWSIQEDTDPWYSANWDGSAAWSPIILPTGLGVAAYPFEDWGQSTQHWHIHVAYSNPVIEENAADSAAAGDAVVEAFASLEARPDSAAAGDTSPDALALAEGLADSSAIEDSGADLASAAEVAPDSASAGDAQGEVVASLEARPDSAAAGDASAETFAGLETPADSGEGGDLESSTQASLEACPDSAAAGDAADEGGSVEGPSDSASAGDASADTQASGELPLDSASAGDAQGEVVASLEGPADASALGDASAETQAGVDAPLDTAGASDSAVDAHQTAGEESPSDSAFGDTSEVDSSVSLEARPDSASSGDASAETQASAPAPLDTASAGDSVSDSMGIEDEAPADFASAGDASPAAVVALEALAPDTASAGDTVSDSYQNSGEETREDSAAAGDASAETFAGLEACGDSASLADAETTAQLFAEILSDGCEGASAVFDVMGAGVIYSEAPLDSAAPSDSEADIHNPAGLVAWGPMIARAKERSRFPNARKVVSR
jgi:hypothetical protein